MIIFHAEPEAAAAAAFHSKDKEPASVLHFVKIKVFCNNDNNKTILLLN